MNNPKGVKSDRVLYIYEKLIAGEVLSKNELAQFFEVTPKSIQRDIDSLRCFLSEKAQGQDVVYDTALNGYKLYETNSHKFTNSEILAVCKILLESRSMIKTEMETIIEKLLDNCVPEQNKKIVRELIGNELYHYIEPHHGKGILDLMWNLGTAIRNRKLIEIDYTRLKDNETKTRILEPVGLLFSEYYFYLIVFMHEQEIISEIKKDSELFPTVYRVDRIKRLKILDEHFTVPYSDRFEEGEFRKRIQFMYGGKLRKIKFKFSGVSIEAVLDRLPTAKILSEDDDGWIVSTEVFGNGIDMWLRSQGDTIKVIESVEY